ncbi:MAG: transglutaminase domain-containing protein [Novosphingobium sp.]
MRLAIRHNTRYEFSRPVAHGLQRLRLRPKPTHGQHVIEWQMELQGARPEVEYDDQHNNRTLLVSVEPGASAVDVACTGLVETSNHNGVIGQHSGHMPLWCFLSQTELTRPGPGIKAMVAGLDTGGAAPLEALHALSRQIIDTVRYEIGRTEVDTTAEAALTAGHGVCQDHAHIFIGAARQMGIPARYVSGYLMMDDRIDQEAGHAWAEAHVQGLGWVGFDVSNGISPDTRYVRVATGSDYREAAPVAGVSYGAGETSLTVNLAVEQQLVEQ